MRGLSEHFTDRAVTDVEKDVVNEILCQYEEAELIGFIIFKVIDKECEILWMAVEVPGRSS